MELNDYSLRQMDENDIRKLPEAALRDLAVKLLQDLKEARERLNQNSRNSSRPPGSDAPWENIGGNLENDSDDDDAAEGGGEDTEVSEASGDAEEVGVEQTEVGRLGDDTSDQTDAKMLKRNPGKQPGAPGFGRQQQLPVSACEEHRPTHCACCGKGFKEVASDSHAYTGFYTLDIEWGDPEAPGLRVTNTQHIYHETHCECGHLTREEPGSQPRDDLLPGVALSEWRLVGPGLSALIVCLAYRMRLSRQRIVEFLSDWFGIQLSVGTVHNTIMESGRATMALEEPLANDMRDSGVLHIDETSWRERSTLLWLWVFTTRTTVVFWIGWRTPEILENLLGEGYEGWLMSDGYNAYRRFLKRCRCWAHLLRKAQGLVECLDSEAQHFGRQTVDVLDTLMAAIRTARDDPPDTGLSRLYGDLLENYRLECERMSLFTHTKARALAVEMLNDWAAIFRVLDHPHLPLTNNEAERALRHWVILRRISYGTKTETGSRVFAILASVIETCRKRQHSPWRYLQAVIANQRAGLPVLPLPIAGGSE